MNLKTILINCKDDYEGKVVANLIYTNEKSSNCAVIHIHGFSDYFFHNHLAEEINKTGIDFYALELRKYGRSKLGHQHDFYFRKISEYYEEITKSIVIILEKGYEKIHLMGHSTGGLIISLYAYEGELKHKISSIILNSPLLNFPLPSNLKKIVPLSGFIGKLFPFAKIKELKKPSIGGIYNDSLHKDYKGEWDYIRKVKETDGIFLSWLNGVNNGFKIIKKGLNLSIPVLILHSSQTFFPKKWDDKILISDVVLKISDMKTIGPTLGSNVTLFEIKDAMHDVYLSKLESRSNAIFKTINWIKAI